MRVCRRACAYSYSIDLNETYLCNVKFTKKAEQRFSRVGGSLLFVVAYGLSASWSNNPSLRLTDPYDVIC